MTGRQQNTTNKSLSFASGGGITIFLLDEVEEGGFGKCGL